MSDYGKYQLQWMIAHGYTLDDLINALEEYKADWKDDTPFVCVVG